MGNAYLLTGESKIGKTTALKKVIKSLNRQELSGFITEEIRENNVRIGFRLITMDNKFINIAGISSESSLRIGKYGVNIEELETNGIPAIYEGIKKGRIIVIDEIGPMQLLSEKFKRAVNAALDSSVPIIGTIVYRKYEWADELKIDKRVNLYELSLENRDNIHIDILNILNIHNQ